eukprot:scaffold115527_cov14-Tisochrysis_lutea.AAC.1
MAESLVCLDTKHSKSVDARHAVPLTQMRDEEILDFAIQEAFTHGLLTASVVNAHTPLDRVTYPIYAGEGHPSYQHFFLDWLLKVRKTNSAITLSMSSSFSASFEHRLLQTYCSFCAPPVIKKYSFQMGFRFFDRLDFGLALPQQL